MPLDALHLYCITGELDALLQGGRIDKVNMPSADEILLLVRARGRNFRLLLSANPSKPRVWLTPLEYVNPAVAPAWCMHLRKYLGGAKLLGVRSDPYDRVVTFTVESKSELGDSRVMRLYVEIMGRYSNMILTDDAGRITDCMKHTPLGLETARPVLPGLAYTPPAQDGKITVLCRAELRACLSAYREGDLASYLLAKLAGLAAMTVREILRDIPSGAPLTESQIDAAISAFDAAYAVVLEGRYTPAVIYQNGRPAEFFALPYAGEAQPRDTLLAAETDYFRACDAAALWQQTIAAPTAAVAAAIKKVKKRVAGQRVKLAECEGAETCRVYGELLTANLYRLKERASSTTLDNYYTGASTVIPLDPTKSAVQNANAYFKRYNKLKRAAEINLALLDESERLLDYLESIRASLATCRTADDAEGVSEELRALGLMRARPVKGRAARPVRNEPLRTEYAGYAILIGKNNLQNDALTFKTAKAEDLWLHVQKAHGSHVIVRNPEGGEIPEPVVLRAARYAAGYSAVRLGTKIAVDATRKKYVTRNGRRPGAALYSHESTLIVDPLCVEEPV